MRHIRELVLSDYYRHKRTVISLPLSGIVLVTGKNGLGKSSIYDGVATAGWGKTVRGKPGWRRGQAGSVEVKSDQVLVNRSITPGGAVKLRWCEQDKGPIPEWNKNDTTAKSQVRLDPVIGEYPIWRQSNVFTLSGPTTRFTKSQSAERMRLVELILQLDRFEPALKNCRLDLGKSEKDLETLQSELSTLRVQKQMLEQAEATGRACLIAVPVDKEERAKPVHPGLEPEAPVHPAKPERKPTPSQPDFEPIPPQPENQKVPSVTPAKVFVAASIPDYQPPRRTLPEISTSPKLMADRDLVLKERETTIGKWEQTCKRTAEVESQITVLDKEISSKQAKIDVGVCDNCDREISAEDVEKHKNKVEAFKQQTLKRIADLKADLVVLYDDKADLKETVDNLTIRQHTILAQIVEDKSRQEAEIRATWAHDDELERALVVMVRNEAEKKALKDTNDDAQRAVREQGELEGVQRQNVAVLTEWSLKTDRMRASNESLSTEWIRSCERVAEENRQALEKHQQECTRLTTAHQHAVSLHARDLVQFNEDMKRLEQEAQTRADNARLRKQFQTQIDDATSGTADKVKAIWDQQQHILHKEVEIAELKASEFALGPKGFRAKRLEKALAGIEITANFWIEQISDNESPLQISLRPYSEKKSSDGIKDSIEILVHGAGGGYGYEGASAGQQRRLDIAIMWGLAEVAGGANGFIPGTQFYDEVFDALDDDGVRAVVGVLRQLSAQRAVVVISHNPVLIEALKPDVLIDANTWDLWPLSDPDQELGTQPALIETNA